MVECGGVLASEACFAYICQPLVFLKNLRVRWPSWDPACRWLGSRVECTRVRCDSLCGVARREMLMCQALIHACHCQSGPQLQREGPPIGAKRCIVARDRCCVAWSRMSGGGRRVADCGGCSVRPVVLNMLCRFAPPSGILSCRDIVCGRDVQCDVLCGAGGAAWRVVAWWVSVCLCVRTIGRMLSEDGGDRLPRRLCQSQSRALLETWRSACKRLRAGYAPAFMSNVALL